MPLLTNANLDPISKSFNRFGAKQLLDMLNVTVLQSTQQSTETAMLKGMADNLCRIIGGPKAMLNTVDHTCCNGAVFVGMQVSHSIHSRVRI